MVPVCRSAAIALAAATLLVLLATSAGAHAILTSTSPRDGERLDEAPTEVTLTFDESVALPTGGARVFDGDGERVDIRESEASEDTISVALPPDLPDGNYIVTWRATSADSHPLKGAFVFSVGAAGALSDSLVADLFAGDADRPVAVLAALVRGSIYVALLLTGGLLAFLLYAGAGREEEERLVALIRRSAAATVGLSLVSLPLQAALETGLGVAVLANLAALGDTVTSGFGWSLILRVAAVAAVLAWARRPERPAASPALVAVGGVAVLSLLLEGHTLTTEPRWLVIAADTVHVLAGAVWFGGLVAMGRYLRGRGDDTAPGAAVAAAGVVKRFSDVATGALVAVTVAGFGLSWVEVRALRAATSTTYGRVLLVKLAIAAGVIAVGAYNNRRLVPAIAAADAVVPAVPAGGSGGAAPPRRADGWGRLRRTVRAEVGALVVLLAVTGVLVNIQPAVEAAGISGAYVTYVPFGEGLEANVVVDPNRAGNNQIHVYLFDATGRPLEAADGLTMALSLPARDIGPIEREPTQAGGAHWILAGNELSIPGAWELDIVVSLGERGVARTTVPVVVNP